LGDLANFLGYAARTDELKPVFAYLVDELAKPVHRRLLAAAMEQQPLDALVSILRSDIANDLWGAVFTDIDIGHWEKVRRAESSPSLQAFGTFRLIAIQQGRPELLTAPVLRLVRDSTPEDWHQPAIGLHHLSYVLWAALEAPSAEIGGFLDRIATPQWVDGLFQSASTGGLAGTILSFATKLAPDRREWLNREALRNRISRELRRLRRYDPEFCAQALSLLGSAAALGVSLPKMQVEWPDTGELAKVLELRAPQSDRTTIGYLQVQLWLGLREMSRMRANPVTVSPRLADRILDLWAATPESEAGEALTPDARALNAEMIEWLRRCKAAGWRLVPPRTVSAPDSGKGRA